MRTRRASFDNGVAWDKVPDAPAHPEEWTNPSVPPPSTEVLSEKFVDGAPSYMEGSSRTAGAVFPRVDVAGYVDRPFPQFVLESWVTRKSPGFEGMDFSDFRRAKAVLESDPVFRRRLERIRSAVDVGLAPMKMVPSWQNVMTDVFGMGDAGVEVRWRVPVNAADGVRFSAESVDKALRRAVRTASGARRASKSRHCAFYRATDGRWYMELADREYGEQRDATTYGPFPTEQAADDYLSGNFSNPGGSYTDDSGEKEPPVRSPNGRPVERPRARSRMWGSWAEQRRVLATADRVVERMLSGARKGG